MRLEDLPPRKKVGRKQTCDCGECKKCLHRIRVQRYRINLKLDKLTEQNNSNGK